MTYQPLNLGTYATQRRRSSGGTAGMNLLTAPELTNSENTNLTQGYLIKDAGKLEVMKGISKIVETTTGVSPSMVEYWVDDTWVIGYGTTIATYNVDTDTFTDVKTDYTSADFTGFAWGDYFYYTNGTTVIQYLTFDYGSELITTSWTNSGSGNWIVDVSGTRLTAPATADSYDADFDFSAELGKKYKLAYQNTDDPALFVSFQLSGPFDTIDLSGVTGSQELVFVANSTADLNALYITNDADSAQISGISIKKQDRTSVVIGSLANSPFCRLIANVDSRLLAFGIAGDEGRVRWSNQDTGEVVPFETWSTVNNPPEKTDPGSKVFSQAGVANFVEGNQDQIVLSYDRARVGFRLVIESVDSVGLAQNAIIDYEERGFGATRTYSSSVGFLYTNKAGAHFVGSDGKSANFLEILGEDYLSDLEYTDIIEDEPNNLIILTAKKESDFSNTVILYNYVKKTVVIKTGWNINRMFIYDNRIYGSDSINGNIYLMFENYDDDGVDQLRQLQYELDLDDDTLYSLYYTTIKGKFSIDTNIEISYDIYDKHGVKYEDVLTETFTIQAPTGTPTGIGEQEIGGAVSGTTTTTPYFERRIREKTWIREFTRLIIKISSIDSVKHELTWISSDVRPKKDNLINK